MNVRVELGHLEKKDLVNELIKSLKKNLLDAKFPDDIIRMVKSTEFEENILWYMADDAVDLILGFINGINI